MLYVLFFMAGIIWGFIIWGVMVSEPLRDALKVIAWGSEPMMDAWLLKNTKNPELREYNESKRIQIAQAILKKQRSTKP